MDIGEFHIRRDGYRLVVHNLPAEWHRKLGLGRSLLRVAGIMVSIIGSIAYLEGYRLAIPIISAIISLILLVEIGIRRTEFTYSMSLSTQPISPKEGPKFKSGPQDPAERIEKIFAEPGPITIPTYTFFDESGNEVQSDIPYYDSEHVKVGLNGRHLISVMMGDTLKIDFPAYMSSVTLEFEGFPDEEIEESEIEE